MSRKSPYCAVYRPDSTLQFWGIDTIRIAAGCKVAQWDCCRPRLCVMSTLWKPSLCRFISNILVRGQFVCKSVLPAVSQIYEDASFQFWIANRFFLCKPFSVFWLKLCYLTMRWRCNFIKNVFLEAEHEFRCRHLYLHRTNGHRTNIYFISFMISCTIMCSKRKITDTMTHPHNNIDSWSVLSFIMLVWKSLLICFWWLELRVLGSRIFLYFI